MYGDEIYLCNKAVWMTYQLVKLFLNKGSLPIAKAGVAAILIDAMFSGSMVYPTSQIACIFFYSFCIFSKESSF